MVSSDTSKHLRAGLVLARWPARAGMSLLAATLTLLSSLALAESRSPEYWLEKLGPAMNMTSYRGVFVYARGDQVSSMQIAHRYRDGLVEERLFQQDGANGEIVRKGMQVVCVLPAHGRLKLEQVIPSGPFAEAFANQFMPGSQWYQSELLGEDRVAGYKSVTLALNARDRFRYSHRLWLEKGTGLLVKGHVRDHRGEVLEHFQFTSLEIRDDLPDSAFQVQSEGNQIERTLEERPPTDNEDAVVGWELGWQPEGFVPAAAPGSGRGQVLAFSDGLAAFSVFVEAAGKLAMPTGMTRVGATTIYMREVESPSGQVRVTVVGEVPPVTARKVAESVTIDDNFSLGREAP